MGRHLERRMMEDSWEKKITEYMQNGGWTKDRDDETTVDSHISKVMRTG